MAALPGEVAVEAPSGRGRTTLPSWLTHPVAAGFLLLVLGCSQTWVALFGDGIGDIAIYERYGQYMVHGLVPYRDFFFDWPPGAVVPLLLPALPGSHYIDWFHALALGYAFACLLLVYATSRRLGAGANRLYVSVAAVALFPAALGAISISSFDYWPALLTVAALAALLRGRDRLALALLGVGIAAKAYPVVLLPIALVWIARRRGRLAALRGLGVCGSVVALATAPFAALGWHGLVLTTVEQLRRGLQMESLGASVLMSLDHLDLVHVHVVIGKPYSLDVVGGGAGAVTAASSLLVVAALGLVYLAYAAGADDPQRLVTASAAAVAAWVAFSHVLSPQFLVWLFPLVPLVTGTAGLRAMAMLLGACATTMTWFPGRFWELAAVGDVSWLVLLRNLMLVALFVVVVAPLVRSGKPRLPAWPPRPVRRLPFPRAIRARRAARPA